LVELVEDHKVDMDYMVDEYYQMVVMLVVQVLVVAVVVVGVVEDILE
jgi:hypothetical protein